jgi:hypothetical protein
MSVRNETSAAERHEIRNELLDLSMSQNLKSLQTSYAGEVSYYLAKLIIL